MRIYRGGGGGGPGGNFPSSVNYISVTNLITQSITPELWFDYIIINNCPTTLSCPKYERVCNMRSYNNELKKFVFTEFSAGIMSPCRFQNEIKLFETEKQMLAHFSAALCHNERRKWVLLDDFQDCCVEYGSL